MTINVGLENRGYDITVGHGLLRTAGEHLRLDRKVLIVSDSGVPREYPQAILPQCADGHLFVFGEGEGNKSLSTFEKLLCELLRLGFSRGDCVAAVGGGVTGDAAGFAAACYMRGIDFYNIPTTLLSQVDSSIGGKTAVNLAGIKNPVGAFWQPRAVLIDTDTLNTLPARQFSCGLAEALKMALTCDAGEFEIFENGDVKQNIEEIICRSLMIKKRIVELDERETGLRRVLNFGHTVGHAIESRDVNSGFYHGECVALGMLPMCSPEVRGRLVPVLRKLGLPAEYSFDADALLPALLHDKKCHDGKITVVYVPSVGEYEFRDVTATELKKYIEEASI